MAASSVKGSLQRIDLVLLSMAAIFIYTLLFKFPFYPFYIEADQLIFLYNADRMLDGERIYADFFQFTFPGGQTLYYLLFLIFGPKFWLLPAATLAMGVASFWLLLRLGKILVPDWYGYVPAILFTFFGFRWFGLDGSHRTFSPLFVLGALLVLFKGRTPAHIFFAGILCALASFFTQQRGLVAAAAFCVFLLIDSFKLGSRCTAAIRDVVIFASGFVLSLFAMLGYFIYTAGWEIFIYSTLIYPSLFYHFHEQNNPGVFVTNFAGIFSMPGYWSRSIILPALFYGFAVPLSVIAFLITYLRFRKDYDWKFWRLPVMTAAVAGLSVLTTTNPSFLRYYHISAPALLLFAWLFWHFGVLRERKWIASAFAVILLIFAAVQAVRIQTNWDYVQIDAPRGRVYSTNIGQIHRYLWLLERTRPGDKVFEVYEPSVYFLLGLKNPTGYTQLYPSDYTRPEFVANALAQLRSDPPKFILWNNSYNKPDSERSSGDHLGPMAKWVQDEYRPASPIYNISEQPIQIWERKTQP